MGDFFSNKSKRNSWLMVLSIILTVIALSICIVKLRSHFYWNIGKVYWTKANVSGYQSLFFEKASYFWAQALNDGPDQTKILLYLGSAYEQAGKPEEAVATWNKLLQPVPGMLAKGQTWLDLQAPHLALPWFRGITLVEPNVSDGWYYTAQAYIQSEQVGNALASLEKALQGAQSGEVRKSQIYFLIGYTYHYIERPAQFSNAIQAYQHALLAQDFPTNQETAEVHFRLCDALWGAGAAPEDYAKECRQAIRLDSKHLLAHFLLGIASYNQNHNVALAEQEFQIAFNIEPSPWGLVMLAQHVYEPAGLKEKARETYQIVLQRWPTFNLAKERLDQLD